jgi:hypothetical protein
MQLTLTDQDARTLHDVLEGYLPELKREAARTHLGEARSLLRDLMQRRELCERLVAELESSTSPATGPI